MLLLGMKSVIIEQKEAEFLHDFTGSFILASEEDVDRLKSFLTRIGAHKNANNLAKK